MMSIACFGFGRSRIQLTMLMFNFCRSLASSATKAGRSRRSDAPIDSEEPEIHDVDEIARALLLDMSDSIRKAIVRDVRMKSITVRSTKKLEKKIRRDIKASIRVQKHNLVRGCEAAWKSAAERSGLASER